MPAKTPNLGLNLAFPRSPDYHGDWPVSLDENLQIIDAFAGTVGGGGGAPGGSPGQLQGNNSGAFAGVLGSSIDFTTGALTLAPPAVGIALVLTGAADGSDVLDITQPVGSSSYGYAVNITTSDTTGVGSAGLNLLTTFTDSTGSGNAAIGGNVSALLDGSNVGTDGITAWTTYASLDSTGGVAGNVTSLYVWLAQGATSVSANLYSLYIEGFNTSGTINGDCAALWIADWTHPGSFAIWTGLGKVRFGDATVINPSDTAVALTVTGDPSSSFILQLFTNSSGGTYGTFFEDNGQDGLTMVCEDSTGALSTFGPGGISISGVGGSLFSVSSGVGFFGAGPITQPTITGSKGGNVALADLLTELANYGLIIDSTT